jgi:hypothetical protein
MEWGGSNIRPEATGYGAVYFGREILKEKNQDYQVRTVIEEATLDCMKIHTCADGLSELSDTGF